LVGRFSAIFGNCPQRGRKETVLRGCIAKVWDGKESNLIKNGLSDNSYNREQGEKVLWSSHLQSPEAAQVTLKLTATSPLKMDEGPKRRRLVFQPSIFCGAIC